jgi:Fic family protein
MAELVAWLTRIDPTPPLMRSALLHLNVIAIHPFNDGSGRGTGFSTPCHGHRDPCCGTG